MNVGEAICLLIVQLLLPLLGAGHQELSASNRSNCRGMLERSALHGSRSGNGCHLDSVAQASPANTILLGVVAACMTTPSTWTSHIGHYKHANSHMETAPAAHWFSGTAPALVVLFLGPFRCTLGIDRAPSERQSPSTPVDTPWVLTALLRNCTRFDPLSMHLGQ